MKIGNGIKNNLSFSRIIVLLTLILLFNYCRESGSLNTAVFVGNTMGTTYSVKIVDEGYTNSEQIKLEIDSILIIVNQQMSTYIPNSELSLFNKLTDTSWFKVSGDLSKVMNQALHVWGESDGFYDITVGPIVNLWGFGPNFIPSKIPTASEINRVKRNLGIDKINIDLANSFVKKSVPNLYCDLSSIAKGFGVDRVALYLENLGYDNYMVEIGGEVRTKGRNDKNEDWKIGISTPLSDGLQKIIAISGVSVATSGDYLNYFEEDGVRYSHLIDPKTGSPIKHNLASVTVIHEDCSFADAYATTINVMGPEIGYEFAVKKKLPVFMIVREGNEFVEKFTPEFKKYIYERIN